jgi:signal transduction histidine kinase
VANLRDELGRLAGSFNELLDRIAAASTRERQFMADAAHELRTPISVIQTATTVMLSSEDRSKDDYRSALATIDVYAKRLSLSSI